MNCGTALPKIRDFGTRACASPWWSGDGLPGAQDGRDGAIESICRVHSRRRVSSRDFGGASDELLPEH